MSDAESAQPEGDTFILPTGFFQHLKYLIKFILGIAWMGGTFALSTLGFFVLFYLYVPPVGEWNPTAWSTILTAGIIGMVLSTTIIMIVTLVQHFKGTIEKGFTAWLKEIADLSILQHGAIFMCFLAVASIFVR